MPYESRTLYASGSPKRFFHVPDGASPPAGALVLTALDGRTLHVDPAAAEAWAVAEDVARRILEEEMALADKRRAEEEAFADQATEVPARRRDAVAGIAKKVQQSGRKG